MKPALQRVTTEPAWSALNELAENLKTKWRVESCVKNTEWETARAIVERESKCAALDIFLNHIEQIAHGE